jgi:ribose 5-phosphate isomerase B
MPNNKFARRGFLAGMAAAAQAAPQGNVTTRTAAGKIRMKLAVGSDHAGFPMKGPVIQVLQSWGHTVKDCGTFSTEPVDFPDIAQAVGNEVLAGRSERGILVCGTGVGAAVAANKIRGIRAALCHDTFCAHQCVEHDNVNVLCMGAWVIGQKTAEEVLTAYLNARFESADPDFQRRLRKLAEMERR